MNTPWGLLTCSGARNPEVESLVTLASAHPDKVFPVALDSADIPLNQAAAKVIEEKFGKLDVVIANAGKLPVY